MGIVSILERIFCFGKMGNCFSRVIFEADLLCFTGVLCRTNISLSIVSEDLIGASLALDVGEFF